MPTQRSPKTSRMKRPRNRSFAPALRDHGTTSHSISSDEGALSQIKTCGKMADEVALMADHHKGYAVPIGGVVAYKNSISPSGVGFDIACGIKAVLLDMPGSALRADIDKIRDDARMAEESECRIAWSRPG